MIGKKQIEEAAIKGAGYGFEKGFECATEYLRSVIDLMPDETTKTLVAKLVEGFEKFSGGAHTKFMNGLEISAIKGDTLENHTEH